MVKIGFDHKWFYWMNLCVESVDYYVLVNGETIGLIILGHGLRQGDPLSLYLFIIYAEGISSLICDAEAQNNILGTRICSGAPPVSHLFFDDDCFLLFRAEENQTQILKDILLKYEVASGQSISLPKSKIFYSQNVAEARKNVITHIIGVRAVLGAGKYLGLPSMIGWESNAAFAYIKDRVWQTINSWSSKFLSKAGREVMIKSVLQAISSYIMSIFQLPSTLINSI